MIAQVRRLNASMPILATEGFHIYIVKEYTSDSSIIIYS